MVRKIAELDLSAAEISNILLENVACGVLLFAFQEENSAYRALYANRSAEMMEAMSCDEMRGLALQELFPYGEGDMLHQLFDEVREKGSMKRLPRTLLRGVYAEGWRECLLTRSAEGKLLMIYLDMTHIQRTEETLRNMVNQLNFLIDFLPDPMFSLDSEGRVETWNRAMEEVTGIPKKSAIGQKRSSLLSSTRGHKAKPISDFFLLDDKSVLEHENIRLHKHEKDTLLVDAYNDGLHGGQGGYLSVKVGALRHEDGSLLGIIQTMRDVTDRVLTSQRLQEEKERLAVTLSSIGDGIIVVDEKSRVTMLNPVAEDLTAWTDEQAQGQHLHDIFCIINETTRLPVENPMDRVLREGVIVGLANHTILVDRQGKERAIADSAAPIKDEQGAIVGGILVFRDVTEQREQELRVQRSEQRFRQLYETMEQGMAVHEIILDAEGKPVNYRFTDVNPSFERLTGLKRTDLVGKTVQEVLPNTEHYWIEQYGEVALTGKPKTFESHSQGLDKDFEVTAYSPMLGTFAVLVSDVTERRKAAEQLRYLSLHDQLTGLHNRHFFEQELERLDRIKATRVGMLFCDVDGLKLLNDTFGHNAGDQLLVAVAKVLKSVCTPDQLLARVGGDEFAVLLFNTNLAELQELAAAIREGSKNVSNAGWKHMPLSVSIGFASSLGEHIPSRELFKVADDNMYREKLHRSGSVRSAAVQALMKALETRDFVTEGHAVRLTELVESFARVLKLGESEVLELRLLAQFHDIGKVGVPDRILFKEGPLDHAEMAEMRRHSEMGHRIAQSVPDLLPIADLILKHHEWWNGCGYPLGLKKEEIPLACRLLAIADAYDAMTSHRPYRKAMPHRTALQELQKCAGMQFDPQLVELLVPVLEAYSEAACTREQ